MNRQPRQGIIVSQYRRANASSGFVQLLEARRLLNGTPVPSETLGVDGMGEYTVHRPSIHLASEAMPQSGGPLGASLPGFQIEVVFGGGLTASQQAVFTTAANRWQQIITGDIPDVAANFGAWGAAVDDVRINASGLPIDGVNGILGQAGPNYIRGGTYLPIDGVMQFDTADLGALESSGQLNNVIIHEMAHVLGLGVIWGSSYKNVISGAGGANPVYTGVRGKLEYNALNRTSSNNVPVENTGGSGTRDSHWRETTFNNELMTGWLDAGSNPLSRITAGQFVDLGYPGVDVDAADLYTIPGIATLPNISGFTDSPDPVGVGNPVTLSLSTASDSDGVASVKFYREANGIAGLQSELGDVLVGTDTTAPYSINAATTGLVAGNYTYYARGVDVWGAVSAPLSLTNTISAVTLPAAPSTPDLAASSDSNINTDNTTNDTTPTFTGTAEAGSTVRIYANSVEVGSGVATGGAYSITTSALPSGSYTINATATNGAGAGPLSGNLTVVIDTVAPVPNSFGFGFNFGNVDHVTLIDFSEDNYDFVASDPIVKNLTTSTTLPSSSFSLVHSGNFNDYYYNPTGAADMFPDGIYELQVPAGVTNDLAGNPNSSTLFVNFFFLNGDATRDRKVDTQDFNVLAANFGTGGAVFTQGNFSNDAANAVDSLDFAVLLSQYGKKLAASPASLPDGPAMSSRLPLFASQPLTEDGDISTVVWEDLQ